MACITRQSDPWVLRGTVTTFRRRCGKVTCRCATGQPHESPALVFTESGRTKTVTLSDDEVGEVSAAVARYSCQYRGSIGRSCVSVRSGLSRRPGQRIDRCR